MSDAKGNEYGQSPLYEVGDRVKVWPILQNPIGTVERIENPDSFPIKYLIRYQYWEGGTYLEIFDECDLTLHERRYNFGCNCYSTSGVHEKWCNWYDGRKR